MKRATIALPMPPSVNKLFANVRGRGRIRTREYKSWSHQAIWTIICKCPQPRLIKPPYTVRISLPVKMRGDLDNRVKAVLDVLVKSGVMDDDSHVMDLRVIRELAMTTTEVWVTVSTYRGKR